MTSNLEEIIDCCKNKKIISANNKEIVCRNCGTVYGYSFVSNEKMAFNKEERRKRLRTETVSKYLSGSRTTINKNADKDGYNRLLSPEKIIYYKRLRKINNSSTKRIEHNLRRSGRIFQKIISQLRINNIIENDALRYYKKIVDKNLCRGRSYESMISACIKYAGNNNGNNIEFSELSEKSGESVKDILKAYKTVVKSLGKPKTLSLKNKLLQYVSKYCSNLCASENKVREIIINALKNNYQISGKDPKGIVAGAIYMVRKGYLTQKEISKKVGVTEVTLRSRYKELKNRYILYN